MKLVTILFENIATLSAEATYLVSDEVAADLMKQQRDTHTIDHEDWMNVGDLEWSTDDGEAGEDEVTSSVEFHPGDPIPDGVIIEPSAREQLGKSRTPR